MKAVVFIDVQNDFVPGGKLPYGYPTGDGILQNIKNFAKAARAKGWALYATADTHEQTVYDTYEVGAKRTAITGYMTTLEGKNLPVEHCVEGTRGHQIVDGLVKDENRNVLIPQGCIYDKQTFGCFELGGDMAVDFASGGRVNEPLDEILICGFCTSICVVSNALILRAQFPNTKITVLEDLCGDINEESHNAALKVMANCQIYAAQAKDYV